MSKISIVIPVYNSQDCILDLIIAIKSAIDYLDYEIILINDFSSDNSWEVIKSIEHKCNLIAINLRKNIGQDKAIIEGLRYASSPYVIIMDDDLQHNPIYIKNLYYEILKGYDVVYANFEKKYQKKWKNLGSKFNTFISELMLRKPKHIYLSPFKIINQEIVQYICESNLSFPYIDAIILNVTANIGQIDNVVHQKRIHGNSNYTFIKSLKVFLNSVTSNSIFPLRLSIYIGIIAFLLGLIYGIKILMEYFNNSVSPAGYTSLMVVVIMFGGVILLILGIIGEYLGRLFMSSNTIHKSKVKDVLYFNDKK